MSTRTGRMNTIGETTEDKEQPPELFYKGAQALGSNLEQELLFPHKKQIYVLCQTQCRGSKSIFLSLVCALFEGL